MSNPVKESGAAGHRKTVAVAVIAAVCLILLIAAAAIILSKCRPSDGDGTDTLPDTSAVTEPASDWDRATLKWKAGTVVEFEVRVRPGVEYSLSPTDHDKCDFVSAGGDLIHLEIQGLIYETGFDQLVAFLKSKNPQKLAVGKSTQTVIAVHDETRAELIFKLTETECLTAIAKDPATAKEFFSNVMIRVSGKDYEPLRSDEEYDIVCDTDGGGETDTDKVGRIFVWEKPGFGGKFTLILFDDGRYKYSVGFLSSYVGAGTWTEDNGTVTLRETSGHDKVFKFAKKDDGLAFIADGSSRFMYVTVEDGDMFLP